MSASPVPSCLQTQLDDVVIKQFETQLQQLRKEIDAVNRERKLQQTAVGRELRELDHEYYGAVAKNLQISLACQKLQEEIDRWKNRMDALEQQQEQQEGQQGQERQPDTAVTAIGVQEQGEETIAASGDAGLANGVANGEGGSQDGLQAMQEG